MYTKEEKEFEEIEGRSYNVKFQNAQLKKFNTTISKILKVYNKLLHPAAQIIMNVLDAREILNLEKFTRKNGIVFRKSELWNHAILNGLKLGNKNLIEFAHEDII
ncbi:hypothetical protein O9G_002189 [Rozella allomycis CSF55]|uniref:Uncharacterized protein n=1 Tax=Rozella allomycis (strain CSF55) TaxID=988480 RepID=A0A075AUX6_ROZAC|nr:hypothetical protein O9G_002189 [Rozella allomycis CSF55]|eukprot:EPZ32349.1 hypothetical protein O9G_002189 [Rozella allomycis CSF55]